jgi:hypothetical protein
MRRGPVRVGLAVVLVAAALAGACGLDVTGGGDFSEHTTPPADATVPQLDGTPPPVQDALVPDVVGVKDAPADAVGETGASDAGADAHADAPDARADAAFDASDGAIVFVCPGGNTTDCATCGGRPLGCVMCSPSGIYAVCVPQGSSCYSSYKPAGYDWCRCNLPDASTCILPNQGCNPYAGGVCVTCGESQTQGDPCKRGGTCNQGTSTCQ